MKTKIFTLLVALVCAAHASAHHFEVDGIYYYKLGGDSVATYCKGEFPNDYEDEYVGEITIPASVVYDGVEYRVTTIGSTTFKNCTKVTSVSLPHTISMIQVCAFENCTSLTTVNIPDNVRICTAAFFNCTSLTSITLGEYLTIDSWAFRGTGLTSVQIPETTIEVGRDAFQCANLETVYWLPKDCILEASPFGGYDGENYKMNTVTKIIFNDNATTIPRYLCHGMAIDSVVLPSATIKIDDLAFSHCQNLKAVTIPDGVDWIGMGAFQECSQLSSVHIGDSVTTIGDEVFGYCTSLQSLTLGKSVSHIGENGFYGCASLTNIEFPQSLKDIGEYAFCHCGSLKSLVLPENVGSVPEGTFDGCTQLRKVEIASHYCNILDFAFDDCTSLDSLVLRSIECPISATSFRGVPTTMVIEVPCGTVESYQTAEHWNQFTNYIEGDYNFHYDVSVMDKTQGIAVFFQEPDCDREAIIQAIPMPGYKFVSWNDWYDSYFPENPLTVSNKGYISMVAYFEEGEEEQPAADVAIIPADTAATFTWSAVENATSYQLIIWANAEQLDKICTLTFNAAGQLITIDFARHKPTTVHTTEFSFPLTGLTHNTTYVYSLSSYDSEDTLIETQGGYFKTTNDASAGVEKISTEDSSIRKLIENGTIYILRDGEKYTLDGRKVE